MDSEQKPKRKRRTPEEIAADKAAKEEEKRLKKGPWTLDELRSKCDEFVKALPKAQRIRDRWDRSKECYVLHGEWSSFGVAEVVGSTGEIYETSLTKCSCRDFKSKRAECCKHQLCLVDYIRGNRTEEQRLKDEAERKRRRELLEQQQERERREREEQLRIQREKEEEQERIEREQELARIKKKRRIKMAVAFIIAALILYLILR